MKLKNYAYRCMAVICAIVAVSCVDEEFSFDKVSKEVSVFDGKTVLPLGTFEKKSLGDLLGSEELPEGITKNEDGSYTFSYNVPAENVSAGEFELPTTFAVESNSSEFEIDLPTLDFNEYGAIVEETFGLNIELSTGFTNLLQNYVPEGATEYTIPSLLFSNIPEEQRKFQKDISEEAEIEKISFELPEQIKEIKSVIFKSIDENHAGAPLSVHLDLKGFAGINGGGLFHFTLKSKSELVVNDDQNRVIEPIEADGYYVYAIENEIATGSSDIGFDLYITSILSGPTKNNPVEIDPSMVFDIDFELNAQAGKILLDGNKSIVMPEVTIKSDFELEDAEVVFNSEIDLFEFKFGENGSEGFNIEINDLPKQIKSIEEIKLTEDSKLTLYATNIAWLGDAVTLDMEMPACLGIKESAGYTYNAETNLLTTTIEAISSSEGLNVLFDVIDLRDIEKADDGSFSIELSPSGRVHFTDEEPMGISGFIPSGQIVVEVGLKESELGFESVSAQVDFSEAIEEDIDLKDLSGEDLPIEIGGSGLSPVFVVTIENPITIDAYIDAVLMPSIGEELMEDKQITFDAKIAQATYDELTGEVVPTVTKIVLAKASEAENYPISEGYTFVACNIDNLISTPLPDNIALTATVSLPDDVIEIHLGDLQNLEFSYAAEFSLPLAFDDQLSISYEDSIDIVDDKGNSPFAEVADIDGLKVGDIALIVELETTLPLEMTVATTLHGKDGAELPTKIGFAEGSNVINGSADGQTPAKSELRMQFNLADENGSLAELADIVAVGLKVAAKSSAEELVALKDSQYIAATLKLELDGGITVDLGALK